MGGIIVAPEPDAVETGAKVLQAGGNAVDAAVTAAFVQGIVNPHMCGVGGYALLTIRLADGRIFALDAPARAGERVTPDMWEDIVIGPNPFGWGFFLQGKVNEVGYQSICTPGWVKGMAAIVERWGSRPWAEATAPATAIAENGFMVGARLAARWHHERLYQEETTLLDYIQANPEASRIYLQENGRPQNEGTILRNPDYGTTLRHVANHGPEDFYQGDLAARMSRDLAANGSFVTAADLAGYQLQQVEPVIGTYRDYTIISAPAPHGGPTLLAILNILEQYDLAAMEHNSADYIYLVSMAMKAAFADRNPNMGDPGFMDVPLEWMMSKTRAAEWRDTIDTGIPFEVKFTMTEPPDTTHVTVVDDLGNCVALTHSLGVSSGVITPGMGFMYNNSMINFHPWAGHPNSIAPGKSRTTGMAPTIVLKDDKPVLVLGSPGATRIITSNVQVIINVLDFGMPVQEAVWAARFDCQGPLIRCHARIPEIVCDQVRSKHPIQRLPQSHGAFALVHAATIDPTTRYLSGGADTGSDGMALRV